MQSFPSKTCGSGLFLSYYYTKLKERKGPRGPAAVRLRQRKYEILRTLKIPPEALPGSLSLSRTRCGKPTCHCSAGEGHPSWSLTFMVKGKKRVERIPQQWLEEVQRRAEQGQHFREAVAELFSANAELLALSKKQRR